MTVTLAQLLKQGMTRVEALNHMNQLRNEVYAAGGKVVRIIRNGEVVEQSYEQPC